MDLFKWVYSVFRTILSVFALVPVAIWRIKWLRYPVLVLLLGLGIATYLFYGKLPAAVKVYDVTWLDQGWTEDQREKYYQTDQGTLIVPYSWFLALEMPPTLQFFENFKLFRDDDNIARYRLIPDPRPKYNPDLLPVGLAKTTVPDEVLDLGLGHKEWLSFSCAACHTAQITYKGLGIRLDGVQGMWDFSGFSTNMTATLGTTRFLPTKFDRFASRVLAREGRPNTSSEKEKLKREVDQYLAWPLITDAIKTTIKRTYPTTEGPGRTDALGRGANGQFAPLSWSNVRTGNAPVSFPPLWYTHDYDWVQSTTGIRQPLSRNVTESWGVNVIVDITNSDPKKLFRSTHPMFNLYWIETLLSVLEHPRWPAEIFGKIDETLAERGRYLYEEAVWNNPRSAVSEIYCGGSAEPDCNPERVNNQKGYCARCHSPVSEPRDPGACDPTADAACQANPHLWQLTLYRLDVLGTDPNDAQNFYNRVGTMDPGAGTYRTAFAQSDLADKTKPNLDFGIGNGLLFTTRNVMDWWFKQNQAGMEEWVKAGVFPNAALGRRIMEGFRKNEFRAPLAYPARPMAGYWATAPFLHNHSVPNLYELLSPVSERSKKFYIGNTEFDPVNVGFETSWFRHGFEFDSSKAGNSMAGHEFSAKPGDPAKSGVIGPWLDPKDRRAILEYMKKISDVPKLSPEEALRRRTELEKMRPFFEGTAGGTYSKFAATYAPSQEGRPLPPKK